MALNKVSVADLAVFHELVNATTISGLKPDSSSFPNLVNWYHNMEGLDHVQLAIEKFMN